MAKIVDWQIFHSAPPVTCLEGARRAEEKVSFWAFFSEALVRFLAHLGRSHDPSCDGGGLTKRHHKSVKIAFFGHFDGSNFGNEATLRAVLYHLRQSHPDAQITCICSGSRATAVTHRVEAIPLEKQTFASSWAPRNRTLRLLRRALLIVVNEPVQWVYVLIQIKRIDMIVVPGTGVLNDAYGLSSWGPHTLFRWSLLAKLVRRKLLVVSIGAGPLYGWRGRWLVKSILRLADFRSYRERSTLDYLASIGFQAAADPVYPDLAYSLPQEMLPRRRPRKSCRLVVGLGVMEYAGKYSASNPTDAIYLRYLEHFSTFAKWLLEHKHDVSLLSGDLGDSHTRDELKSLIRDRTGTSDFGRVVDEPPESVDDLLSHIAATDIVVATRFHNILFALLCSKPVIAISFHHKCRSLMRSVGLDKYCLDINEFNADSLIETFMDLQKNAGQVVAQSEKMTKQFRDTLDQQYRIIFGNMWPAN